MTEDHAREVGKALSARLYPGAAVWDTLGAGSFGAVYRVWQHPSQDHDGRWAAIKLPYPVDVLVETLALDPGRAEAVYDKLSAKLRRDATVLVGIDHPSVVTTLGASLDDEPPHLVTELLEGETLARRLDGGQREGMDFVYEVLRGVGGGLMELHAHGITHRDVSPRHILIRPEGGSVLVDFGFTVPEGDAALARYLNPATTLFASPEVLSGGALTPWSDQYSLGMILLRILGNPAPQDEGAPQDSRATLDFLSRTRPDCPLGVYSAIARMLKHEPEDRWPTMADAMEALEGVLEGRPVPRGAGRGAAAAPPASVPASVPVAAPLPEHPEPVRDAARERWSEPPAAVAAAPSGSGGAVGPGLERYWRPERPWRRFVLPLVVLLVLVPAGVFFWPRGEEAPGPESSGEAGAGAEAGVPQEAPGGEAARDAAPGGADAGGVAGAARQAAGEPTEPEERPRTPAAAAEPTQPANQPATQPATQPVNRPGQPVTPPAAADQPPPSEPEVAEPPAAEPPAVTVTATLTGSAEPLIEGEQRRFGVDLRSDTGMIAGFGEIGWRTSDGAVLSVDAGGRVTALGPGAAFLVVRYREVEDSLRLEVLPRPASIEIAGVPRSLEPGDVLRPVAAVRDRRGQVVDVSPVWSSSNADVLGVVGGQVRGRGEGTAILTASVGDLRDSVVVTVAAPPPILPTGQEVLALLEPVIEVLGSGDARAVAVLPLESTSRRNVATLRDWSDQEALTVRLLDGDVTPVPMADLSRAAADFSLGFEWNFFAGSRAEGTARLRAVLVRSGDAWVLERIEVRGVEGPPPASW